MTKFSVKIFELLVVLTVNIDGEIVADIGYD